MLIIIAAIFDLHCWREDNGCRAIHNNLINGTFLRAAVWRTETSNFHFMSPSGGVPALNATKRKICILVFAGVKRKVGTEQFCIEFSAAHIDPPMVYSVNRFSFSRNRWNNSITRSATVWKTINYSRRYAHRLPFTHSLAWVHSHHLHSWAVAQLVEINSRFQFDCNLHTIEVPTLFQLRCTIRENGRRKWYSIIWEIDF